MMWIVFVFTLLFTVFPFCSFSQQEWNLQNPIVKHYYQIEGGVINANNLSDSVITNLVGIKKTKKYLDICIDVFNKSNCFVAARIPTGEDLTTGEVECYISCGSDRVLYNIAYAEFRYSLISSKNSVMVAPRSHYRGFLRLNISNIEQALGLSLNKLTKKRFSITLKYQIPKHIISQFDKFSYFNFGQNQISFP